MSMLACDRKDCENIMCDRLIGGHYVCNECLAEFRAAHDGNNEASFADWGVAFAAFMTIPKPIRIEGNDAWRRGTAGDFLAQFRDY